jgi:hypothetical protein
MEIDRTRKPRCGSASVIAPGVTPVAPSLSISAFRFITAMNALAANWLSGTPFP